LTKPGGIIRLFENVVAIKLKKDELNGGPKVCYLLINDNREGEKEIECFGTKRKVRYILYCPIYQEQSKGEFSHSVKVNCFISFCSNSAGVIYPNDECG